MKVRNQSPKGMFQKYTRLINYHARTAACVLDFLGFKYSDLTYNLFHHLGLNDVQGQPLGIVIK